MTVFRIAFFYFAMVAGALAAPGAHGPNGEHLDAPGGQVQSNAGPRIETFTESFELVGQLHAEGLSIVIDRYETNEPVLGARLEVEFDGRKALAKFHADHGDYAVDDPQFMKALAQPGKHSLIFTLAAGQETDLLEGVLDVPGSEKASARGHGHEHGDDDAHGHAHAWPTWLWASAGGLISLALLALLIPMLRRKSPMGKE